MSKSTTEPTIGDFLRVRDALGVDLLHAEVAQAVRLEEQPDARRLLECLLPQRRNTARTQQEAAHDLQLIVFENLPSFPEFAGSSAVLRNELGGFPAEMTYRFGSLLNLSLLVCQWLERDPDETTLKELFGSVLVDGDLDELNMELREALFRMTGYLVFRSI